jgi:acetyl esterase/lipase
MAFLAHHLIRVCIPCQRALRIQQRPWFNKRLLSTVKNTASVQTVEVPRRSTGSIFLRIYPPLKGDVFSKTILYLHPGIPLINQESNGIIDYEIISGIQSAATSSTIVDIGYRADPPTFRYPSTIHDVLAGYDWVVNRQQEQGNFDANMGVCGQLLGGSLGAMLALTESKSKGNRIVAAALNNPIVDWVVPEREELELEAAEAVKSDGMKKPKRSKRKQKAPGTSWTHFGHSTGLSSSSLLDVRKLLFKNSDAYIDPFASPIHFFRTTGYTPATTGIQASAAALARKSPRGFPPAGSDLILPSMRVSVGQQNLLLSQTLEFMERLKKIKDKMEASGLDPGEDELIMLPKEGLWNDTRSDIESAGEWLEDMISR